MCGPINTHRMVIYEADSEDGFLANRSAEVVTHIYCHQLYRIHLVISISPKFCTF